MSAGVALQHSPDILWKTPVRAARSPPGNWEQRQRQVRLIRTPYSLTTGNIERFSVVVPIFVQ